MNGWINTSMKRRADRHVAKDWSSLSTMQQILCLGVLITEPCICLPGQLLVVQRRRQSRQTSAAAAHLCTQQSIQRAMLGWFLQSRNVNKQLIMSSQRCVHSNISHQLVAKNNYCISSKIYSKQLTLSPVSGQK